MTVNMHAFAVNHWRTRLFGVRHRNYLYIAITWLLVAALVYGTLFTVPILWLALYGAFCTIRDGAKLLGGLAYWLVFGRK